MNTADAFVEAFARAHREAQEAFSRGDFETAFAGLASDVEWHLLPSLLETGTLHGRDAVISFFRGIRDGIDWDVRAQEFIDAGEGRVIVHQHGEAVGRTTRIEGERDFYQLWEIGSEGRVIRITEYEERDEVLAAAGLNE